jgi:L-fuconate dehydratase
MTNRFVELSTHDVRFPTSRQLDGSDAMNTDPDYSAAYVVLRTDAVDGHEGHGFAFTIGRGNEVQTAAIFALEPYIVGRLVPEVLDDLGGLWRTLVHDSQLRWLGPETGVMHMAIAAVVNALWDLRAKRAGLPLWRLLAAMPPEELVELVDFRYLTDALTPAEALALLRPGADAREERIATLLADGYPRTRRRPAGSATTTTSSPGCAARPSPPGSPRSSSRSAPTSTTTCAGCASPGTCAGRTCASP